MPTDPLAQRLRLAIVLGLLLLVGLTALNLLQAASGLRKDNARSLNHARAMIESAINDSQSLVEAAHPLAMGRCQDEQLALRDLITASPYARALYVLEGSNCAVPPCTGPSSPGIFPVARRATRR
ncbi:CSS-motif domain-containing protein [Aeromonas caviae]